MGESQKQEDENALFRRDVIDLSSKILINLGLINGAALGASFANVQELQHIPYETFAIGLMAAVVSQIWWYFDMELEYTYREGVFNTRKGQILGGMFVYVIIVSSAILSACCVLYGCFRLIEVSHGYALLCSILLCFLPLILFICIVLNKELSR